MNASRFDAASQLSLLLTFPSQWCGTGTSCIVRQVMVYFGFHSVSPMESLLVWENAVRIRLFTELRLEL